MEGDLRSRRRVLFMRSETDVMRLNELNILSHLRNPSELIDRVPFFDVVDKKNSTDIALAIPLLRPSGEVKQ